MLRRSLAILFLLGLLVQSNAYGEEMMEKATFAGGCFWCVAAPFDKMDGIIEAVSGYTGGETADPTYNEVSSGSTGHFEAVQITYDPSKISYRDILSLYWKQIDPTDPGGQFADRGPQYKTAIFYHTEEQRRIAEESKADLERSGKFDGPIATEIVPYKAFYKAEEYHQEYHKKNPEAYKRYKKGSGRERFIEEHWNDE